MEILRLKGGLGDSEIPGRFLRFQGDSEISGRFRGDYEILGRFWGDYEIPGKFGGILIFQGGV